MLFCFVFILALFSFETDAIIVGSNEFQSSDFLIDDGTLKYRGWIFEEFPASSNPYGIEIRLNATINEEVEVTSLSDTVVKFEASVSLNAENCYQKRDGVSYSPISYGIRYYNGDYEFIGTDDNQYEFDGNVNIETGTYSLFHAPQGASYFAFTAYFDSVYVYEWVSTLPIPFAEVGEYNGFFIHNISEWSIGSNFRENYTVSGESTYEDYETWVLEPVRNFAGLDVFEDRMEWEKTSGLFLQQDSRFAETNAFEFEHHLKAIQYEDLILAPSFALGMETMILVIGGISAAAIVVAYVIFRRKGQSLPE